MDSETTETGASTETGAEDTGATEVETVAVAKADYDKLNQTLGSLKRELKDLKKPKTEETSQTNKPDSSALLQKSYLRAAGITHAEDVALALDTAKKWGVEVDALVDDEDFKVKLEKAQTKRSNEAATSNVKGGQGTTQAKNTLEYWVAKGTPPSPADIPNNKTRQAIVVAMMKQGTGSGKVFYND